MPKANLDSAYEILLDYGYIKPGVSDYDYWKALKTATLDFKEENNLEYFDVVRGEEKELRKKVVPKVKKKTITGAAFKKGTAQEVDEKVQADTTGTSSIVPFKKSPSVDSKDLDSVEDPVEEEPDLKSPDKDDNKVDQVLKFLKTDLVSKLNDILDGLNGIGESFKEQSEVTEERLEKQRLLMSTAKKRTREKTLETGKDSKSESMGEKILKSAAKPVKGFLSTIWKFVSNVIAGAVFSFLLKVVKDPAILLDPIKKFFNSIIGLFNVVVKGLWSISAGPINMVIDGLNAGVEALLGAINKAIGLLGLKPIQPPTIPNIPGPPTVPTIPLSKTAQAETVETKVGGGEVGASDGADGADGVDGVEKTSQSFTTSGGVEADQLKDQMADSRQDFNQDKPKEGGLVQPMAGGGNVSGSLEPQGFENITNTETTSFNSEETGKDSNFSFEKRYVSPEEAKERVAAMGMPSMELMDGTVVPDFGKMGGESVIQGLQLTKDIMVENEAPPQKIAEIDKLMVMPDAQPEVIATKINQIVPGSMENTLMNVGTDISSSAKEQSQGQNNRGVVQPMAGGGIVDAKNISAKEGGPIKNDSGVSVTGLGPDTQLVAAQPGEVVMSKKAVDHFGRDRLLQMNKEGGGTNENRVTTTNNIQPKAGGGEVEGKSVKAESGKLGGGLLNILKGGVIGMFAPQMMLLKPMLNVAESIAEKVIPQMGKAVDGTKNLILKHPAIGFAKLIFGEEKVNSWLGLTSSEGKESSPSTQSDSISPSLKSSDISPPSTAPKTNVINIPSPPQSSGGGGGSTPTSPNFSSVDPNNLSAIAVRPIYNLAGA